MTNAPRKTAAAMTSDKTDRNGSFAARDLKQPGSRWKLARKMWMLYLFFLVPACLLFIFNYVPMYGVLIAFKKFRIASGILGSPWNDFQNFKDFFATPFFLRILRNTVIISLQRLVFGFPAPIILALLLNEVNHMPFKRVVQTISYLPHFMSWVVLAGIIIEVLSPQRGLVGVIYGLLGMDAPNLMNSRAFFRPMLIATGIWQSVGWGTIIYLAAISSIDPEMYEAAEIDGASRLQRAAHITIPSLVPVIIILFILSIGGILNAGFDQIFNLYSPLVYEVADIIDTYVYRVGITEMRFDYSTAVGLFKNAIGIVLLLGTNLVTRRFSEYGIW